MDVVSLIGIILGSNVVIEVIKHILNRKQAAAGTIKLRNESGQIVLEGELKVSEFYKKEWQELLQRYELLEKRLDDKVKELEITRMEMEKMQAEQDELKRELALLKVTTTKFNS